VDGSPRLSLRNQILVAEGFGTSTVEFLVLDVSGQVLEHRWISGSDGSPAQLDLSARKAQMGVLVAMVRSPRGTALAAKFQTIR